jgi:hypothetical protein
MPLAPFRAYGHARAERRVALGTHARGPTLSVGRRPNRVDQGRTWAPSVARAPRSTRRADTAAGWGPVRPPRALPAPQPARRRSDLSGPGRDVRDQLPDGVRPGHRDVLAACLAVSPSGSLPARPRARRDPTERPRPAWPASARPFRLSPGAEADATSPPDRRINRCRAMQPAGAHGTCSSTASPRPGAFACAGQLAVLSLRRPCSLQ